MPKHSLEPKKLDKHTWFYDDRSGIKIFHECYDANGEFIRVDEIRVPWRKMKDALARHYA